MELEYFYCDYCGLELLNSFVVYGRTVANGDLYICPTCGHESFGVSGEDID